MAYVRPFVTNVGTFDNVLRVCGAIISGPTALHFFLPDASWSPCELDIYVPASTYKRFVRAVIHPDGLRWKRALRLGHTHGVSLSTHPDRFNDDELGGDSQAESDELPIHLQPLPHEDADEEHGPDNSRTNSPESETERTALHVQLEHVMIPRGPTVVWGHGFRTSRTFVTPSGLYVNVVSSPSNNPITPLRFFWSSLMMNFITPDACVCGYPSATLLRLGTLGIDESSLQQRIILERYRARGFNFADGEALRNALDMWDSVFFGQLKLLAMDFRDTIDAPRRRIPILCTVRGWLADREWRVATRRKCTHELHDRMTY